MHLMSRIATRTIAALVFISALAAPVFAQLSPADKDYVNKTLFPATVLLYRQTESGSMDMVCTGTAIEKTDKGYVFVTASHCGCDEDKSKNVVSPEKASFFISPDITGNKLYLKATPEGCGFRSRGDDFFILSTDATVAFPIIPTGTDPKLMDEVINVGGPLGLGKQVFTGSISSPILDRPVIFEDINWENAIMLQMFGINGGSSGSSLVCLNQHAICGFVVGSIDRTSVVAMPVSRFTKFRAELKTGTYRWYRKDSDQPPPAGTDSKSAPTVPHRTKLLSR
jgi:hypothetical protein